MINIIPRNFVRFFAVILFQVLILNNIQLHGLVVPYFYVIFILLMPFETPGWLLMLSGFVTGITMDAFELTYGMHTSACVFMAFLRPHILRAFAPRDGYESSTFPRVFYYGFNWFLKYTIILVFAHHSWLFFVEVFTFQYFFHTFSRIVISTVSSTFLIMLSQYFVFRK